MLTVMFGFGLLMSVYVHRDIRIGRHGARWGRLGAIMGLRNACPCDHEAAARSFGSLMRL